MFSTKQSDIFYNDETKEMFVCTVSSISADKCDDTDELVYGAVPLIYKINKNTNYKSRVYPESLNEFSSDTSDLFALTPSCPEGTNFDSITKPLVNYNKTTDRYSVTFLGRYSADTEGLGINNYIFKHVDNKFYLLDSKVYIPKDKFTDDQFTFQNGHINSDLYVVGNTIRNGKPSWFNPAGVEVERSTDYQIAPMYVQATSALGFNLILANKNVTIDALSGDVAYPFMYSGGFITYNPKYTAYDPEHTIRVDFRARCFNKVNTPTAAVTAYASSQSVGQSATRWIQQYTPEGSGEGFCVSFFKNPPSGCYVIPNGIGSTLGYAKADFSSNEVAGTAHATEGLYVHNNWNPYTGHGGCVGTGYFGPAESFLGVGFDVAGNFASTSEDKPGWLDGTSYTATPCSIGIRASSYYDTQVLTSFAMNTVAASSVPMHTSAADADFVDYRIDLSNKGTKVTLYNKLTSATDYNTIAEYRLNKGAGGCVGIGTTTSYQPWYGLTDDGSGLNPKSDTLPPLNVGLSFTTSTYVSRFELHKFEVTGVVVNNPWEKKEEQKATTGVTKKIDYLQESSKNLRKKLINVESDEPVDVEMIIPAKDIIANTVNEELNKPQITLCDGSDPEVIEEDVDIRITGLRPNQIDKTIEVAERGQIPKLPDGVTKFKPVGRDLDIDTVIDATGATEKVSWDSWLRCRIPHLPPVSYDAEDIVAGADKGHKEFAVQHTGKYAWLVMTDRTYSIYVQVIVLNDFVDESDLNDWFVKHPFKGKVPKGSRQIKEDRGRSPGSEYAIRANSILKSIIKAFINTPKVDPTARNFALKWHAAPERPSDLHKNELLSRINPDTNEPYIGTIEENWVQNFTNLGFVTLPSDWKSGIAAFGSNTLQPGPDDKPTVPEFGQQWACAASWEPPVFTGAGTVDPVSEGTTIETPPDVLIPVFEDLR